jgi:6,7-dimethyl-8-ribityllumazine synthase
MTSESDEIETIEGDFTVPNGARFALVAARFNSFIVDALLTGAIEALKKHGASTAQISVVRVPGSWEIPLVCERLASSKKYDAIVALGAVIRGGTAHFEHVANAASRGISEVALKFGIPVVFGVLTTDTVEQASDRAGPKAGNKGFEAALAAIEMVSLDRALTKKGL